ncbi:33259_t:CDS:2, partial [Gigaspora margarita]
KQVISLYKRLNSTSTKALATELKLRQGFNDARIINIMSDLEKIGNIKKIWKFNLACLVLLKAEELKFHFNFSSELWQIEQGDRRNRKLAPEYVIFGYNSLALSIALSAVSLDKRKKELVLVENKNNDRKIFKITQKGNAKILGVHYCNIPLADSNQFEIKKCKGYSGNTAKITGKVDEK